MKIHNRSSTLALLLFVSAAPASARVESRTAFSDALEAIVASDTELGAQRARVDASRARLLSAQAAFLPTLTLSAAEERRDIPRFRSRIYDATAGLNLFRFGADRAGWKATNWEVDGQVARLRATELQAESRAVDALVAYIERARSAEIQKNRIEFTSQYHAIAKARFNRGALPAEEVDKASVDLANGEAALQDAQRLLHSAAASLRASVHERHAFVPESMVTNWPWQGKLGQSALRRWLEARPDASSAPEYAAAQAAAVADDERTRRAWRLILPSLHLSYSLKRYAPEAGAASDVQEGLLVLSVPLFEGFTDYAAYRQQSAAAIASRLAFEETARSVPSGQDVAQKNFSIAWRTAQARERTLSTARALLKTALERFRVGKTRADELLLDQSRVLQAEQLAVDGWAEAHRSAARLLHAFGQSARAL